MCCCCCLHIHFVDPFSRSLVTVPSLCDALTCLLNLCGAVLCDRVLCWLNCACARVCVRCRCFDARAPANFALNSPQRNSRLSRRRHRHRRTHTPTHRRRESERVKKKTTLAHRRAPGRAYCGCGPCTLVSFEFLFCFVCVSVDVPGIYRAPCVHIYFYKLHCASITSRIA